MHLDPLVRVFQVCRAQAALAGAAAFFGRDELRGFEDANVLHDAGERHPEGLRKLTDRGRPPGQARKNVAALRVGERRERAVERLRLNHSVNYTSTEYLAATKSPFRPISSRRSSIRRGSSGAPAPSVTGAIDTMTSSSSPASANWPARSPPPTIQMFRSPAARVSSSCTVATSALVNSMRASG